MNLVKKENKLTAENILSKITSYDIYRYYLGVDFKIGKDFCNPIRNESFPSMAVFWYNGELFHKDMGNLYFRGSCFNLVMQAYNCSFPEALKIIDRDFRLGLEDGANVQPIKIEWKQPEVIEKKPPFIQVSYRNPNSEEIEYWNRLLQSTDDLRAENVYTPSSIWIDRKKVPIKKSELVFCYYFPDDTERFEQGSWKIYKPFSDRKFKWRTNTTFSYVENLSAINHCDRAFLTKSKKEKMLMKKILQTNHICTVQAENPAAISDEALKHIINNSREQYTISDCDSAGKQFSWFLTRQWGFKHINPPDHYLQRIPKCTDFADVQWQDGKQPVIEHFKRKGLL